jgi:hypothetical protein
MLEKIALTSPGGYTFEPVAGMPGGGMGQLQRAIRWGVTALFIGATLLALAFLIMGGIQWIMSGGDKAAIESARKKIVWAVIGLIVTFGAYLVLNILGSFFGLNLLSPDCPIGEFPRRLADGTTVCR